MAAANRNKILLLIAVDKPSDAEGPTGPFREGVRRLLHKHRLGRKRIATELHHHLQELLVLGKLTIGQGKRVAAEFYPSEPNVNLVIKEPDPLPTEVIDEILLSCILDNFVHNAVKYTERGTIVVSAEPVLNGQAVRFVVRDSGIGIAPEVHFRICDEFVQVRHPLQRRMRGQDLGLTLGKRLAKALDATIMLESELGKGSTFSVTAPCEPIKALVTADDQLQKKIRW